MFNNVIKIDNNCFKDCDNLSKLELSTNLKEIDNNCFDDLF